LRGAARRGRVRTRQADLNSTRSSGLTRRKLLCSLDFFARPVLTTWTLLKTTTPVRQVGSAHGTGRAKNRASTGASFWCAPSFCDRLHPQVQVQVKPSSRCRMVPTDGPEGRPKVSSNAVRAANKHPCNCPCRCAHFPYTCRAGCDAVMRQPTAPAATPAAQPQRRVLAQRSTRQSKRSTRSEQRNHAVSMLRR